MPQFVILGDGAGLRLDQFLVAQLPHLSRSRIQQLILAHDIRLNEGAAKASVRLREADRISVAEPPPTPLAAPAQEFMVESWPLRN